MDFCDITMLIYFIYYRYIIAYYSKIKERGEVRKERKTEKRKEGGTERKRKGGRKER